LLTNYITGGGTTVTALSGVFYYLSRHPHVYKRLAEEIRSTFKSGDDIKGGPALSGCHYLRACIDETLRISPSVPGTLWRERSLGDESKEPFLIDGHPIPEGTIFGVNIYSLHHNEEYFPDPYTFKPERWLPEGSSDEQRRVMNSAFASFMIGARGCAGKSMAYLEIGATIAKTLFYFDFEQAPGKLGDLGSRSIPAHLTKGEKRDEFAVEDIFTANHDGPYLTFRPRLESTEA
jgi:cytochrome P450